MREWQPIDTAPKDGTEIDVWRIEPPHESGMRFIEVSWREGSWKWWYDRDQEYIDLNDGIWRVTHWMAAPPPPDQTTS